MTQDRIPDMPEYALVGQSHALPATRHVTSPAPALAGNAGATWPNSPFTHPPQPAGHLPLSAAGVMSPEFARVPVPDQGRWLVHAIPLLGSGLIDWAGFWTNAEPKHALIAAIPIGLGTAATLGAIVAAVAAVLPSKSATEIRDNSATRMIAGGGVALLSLGAMMGAGVSGAGCTGALTTVAGAYIGWAGWIGHRRKGNQQVVIELARAAAAQPMMFAPQPPPGQAYLPGSSNPYEARVLSALEAMGFAGATAGPPQAIGENAWKIRVALPQGRNISPDKIVAQTETLASNMQARRVEAAGFGGNFVEITAFEGADPHAEGTLFRWNNKTIESLSDPMEIAIDEAGRLLEITIDGHVLISGSTGSGKSKLVRLILGRTLGARNLVRFGIDCKPGAVELGMFEPVMHFLARTPLDAVRLHTGLKAIIAVRGLILEENDADTWRPEFGPELLIGSDERAVILRDFPKAANLIEENMQMIRFVGGKFIDATQTPSASVYGDRTDARHQYDIRIGLSNESTVNQMVFGGKASTEGWRLEKLDAKGKLLIRTYAHRVPRPYKSLWAERVELQELVNATAGRGDKLEERTALAFAEAMDAFNPAEFMPDPPRGGRRKDSFDPIDAAQEFHYTKPRLVAKYPDGGVITEARQILWDAIGAMEDGFTYRELAAMDLPGYGARTTLQTPLDAWRLKGWIEEVGQRGNTTVYRRCTMEDEQRRREAERRLEA